MQPSRTLAPGTALLAGVLAISCGSQIGNPTGAGLIRYTENPDSLNTLINATFLQTIDGMNMGDYAYSTVESRVSTDRSCQTQAGSGLSLVDKADSNHSVIDDTDEWYAKSDVTIKRSYEDAWTQEGVLLACNPVTRAVSFQYESLLNGPIVLESRVDEDLTRSLFMTEKKLHQELRHSLTMKKTGQRTLTLNSFQEDGQEVTVYGQQSNQLSTTVKLPSSATEFQDVTLTEQDRFPLDLSIAFDQNQQWIRYQIPNGQLEFQIPESGESLRLEFLNLTFNRENGCVPVSGQLKANITHSDQTSARYAITFQPNMPLLLQREGGSDTLVLAPFACVLKERPAQ